MPRFRVVVTTEEQYIDDVEANTDTDAATIVADRIRAYKIRPIVVGIVKVDITQKADRPPPA
jgi:hypothetical protein